MVDDKHYFEEFRVITKKYKLRPNSKNQFRGIASATAE